MRSNSNGRYVVLALAALFAGSSLASPSLFVLCTGEGDIARIEVFHVAHGECAEHVGHTCGYPGDPAPKISHQHSHCLNYSLPADLGLVKEREKLPEISCLLTTGVPWPAGEGREVEGSDKISNAAPVHDRPEQPPGLDLQSVVLLI